MNSFKTTRLLAALAVLTCWNLHPAHANGVSGKISNGQTVTGQITGSGSDSHSFKVTAGSAFFVTVSETGTHDQNFVPQIDLIGPGSGNGRGIARPLYARVTQHEATEGTWEVKVRRNDGGNTGGSYALTLVQVPGGKGTPLTSGVNSSGTITRGGVDVWTFSGTAGHTAKLTLTPTGGAGFAPEAFVFAPSGGQSGGISCDTGSCSQDIATVTDGKYTVTVWKADDNDVAGAYTLSVTTN